MYLEVAAALIETRDFLLAEFLFAGVNGFMVMPGSTFGLSDRLIRGECNFLYLGESECRPIDLGVRGESNKVNLRRRLAATGLLVGDDSESGMNPGVCSVF